MASTTVNAQPDQVNLKLYAGDDFYLDLTVQNPDGTNANLTGMIARADIRQAVGSVVLASFSASVTSNIVSLSLRGTDTATLPAAAIWDCQVQGADVRTVAAGTIQVKPQVTT